MIKTSQFGISLAVAACLSAGSLQAGAAAPVFPNNQQDWSQVPFFKYPSSCTQTNVKGTYILNATEGSHGGNSDAIYAGTNAFSFDSGVGSGTQEGTISTSTMSVPAVPLAGMIAFDGLGRYRAMLSGPFSYGPGSNYPNIMVFDGNYMMMGCVLYILTEFEALSEDYDAFEFYAHINPLQNTMTFSAYLEDWYPTGVITANWQDVFFGGMGGKASSSASLIPFTSPTQRPTIE